MDVYNYSITHSRRRRDQLCTYTCSRRNEVPPRLFNRRKSRVWRLHSAVVGLRPSHFLRVVVRIGRDRRVRFKGLCRRKLLFPLLLLCPLTALLLVLVGRYCFLSVKDPRGVVYCFEAARNEGGNFSIQLLRESF